MCVFGAEGEQTEKRRKQRTRTMLATYVEYLDQTICFIVWQTTRHLKKICTVFFMFWPETLMQILELCLFSQLSSRKNLL
jgi:hypothetical protein